MTHFSNLRAFIAWACLRALYPKALAQAERVVLLPLNASMQWTHSESDRLLPIPLTQRAHVHPVHPSSICLCLWPLTKQNYFRTAIGPLDI